MTTLSTRRWPDLDLEAGLRDVEAVLARECGSEEALLARMARDIVTAGGKRLRPRVTLLAFAALSKPDVDEWPLELADAAAASELIHTATLVHDDIIDQSPLRRGRPTLHLTYGMPHAIVAADYLFTRGFGLAANLPKRVIHFMTDACTKLAEGEILEQRLLTEDLDVESYFKIIFKKTAAPIVACAKTGAHMAGAPDDVVDAFGEFGLDVGLAFQIQDDLLDILGDAAETGKPVGVDAKAGVRTLPELLAGSAAGRSRDDMIANARRIAAERVARGKAAIDPVTPDGPYKDALFALADSVLARRA